MDDFFSLLKSYYNLQAVETDSSTGQDGVFDSNSTASDTVSQGPTGKKKLMPYASGYDQNGQRTKSPRKAAGITIN